MDADTTSLGIDLAWGERARTGLAVLSADGRLRASTAVQADDEICAFVTTHAAGPTVAAIDAPLIVVNPTGRRRCEAEVQALFGRYHAGAYPSNLANPAFANGTRGARLCTRLGLDIDAFSTGDRRAIEVYPHPAMVVLFGLERIIPYKAKRGRTLDDLRRAFEILMSEMEHHVGAELGLAESPRWQTLRGIARGATRKCDLDRIEDEIDAIFCAHLARRWALTGTEQNLLLGDDATGYIVTPAATPRVTRP